MGRVQGYSEPDFDMPTSDSDFLNDETEELLALVEVQLVDGGSDLVAEVLEPVSQIVLPRQLLALVEQCLPLPLKRAMAEFQFLATAQELILFDETCLVEIGQPPALTGRGIELVIQPRKLRCQQLAIFGFPSHGNC